MEYMSSELIKAIKRAELIRNNREQYEAQGDILYAERKERNREDE